MSKWLPVLAGLGLLLGGGVVHGVWTGRWSESSALPEAVAVLERLPHTLGAWKSEKHKQDPEALALAGAAGHFSRAFTDPKTGDKVLVILLCGKPAHMVVHRPEDCYRAAGYEMSGPAFRIKARAASGASAELFTGLFGRDEAGGPSQVRIFWSWLAPGEGAAWEAPSSPRFRYARKPVLFKLYVIRNTSGSAVPAAEDPALELIDLLLPAVDRELSRKDDE
jgi:hypothetical protein